MAKELTSEEIAARFAEINAREPEVPTEEDLAAIATADEDDSVVTLSEYKAQKEKERGL